MGEFTSIYEPMRVLQNIIIWADGIVRPRRGHNNCTGIWIYDGQIFAHKCSAQTKQTKGDTKQ